MTSKIKVDNINKVSDDSNIIKKCGTTTTIGSGASNPIVVDGSAITLGRCGGTVALASGATQTGFGRTGTVDWQTSSIKTATFTAANGEGYFANTSGGAFTMNLPAGSAGAIVSVVDYTDTFQTNSLTITPNGSDKIGGGVGGASFIANVEGQSLTFVYVDGTEGWKAVLDSTTVAVGNDSLCASVTGTGNTLTICGNFKIATFTGPGSFVVNQVSGTAAENVVGYMVVAGGGGGSAAPSNGGGGGGAGGYREGRNVPIDNFTASPLVANAPTNAVTVTAQSYPITVGGGGTGSPNPSSGTRGSNSIFDSITSTGGGGGHHCTASPPFSPGGSGGGIAYGSPSAGGSGNSPPVSPPQGNNGGTGNRTPVDYSGSGGGGASAAGGTSPPGGGDGGAGVSSSITAASVTRAGGGGGGGTTNGPSVPGGAGGAGGGAAGSATGGGGAATATVNTGGGGGGGGSPAGSSAGGNGGSGIVVIRYKFA